MGHGGDIAKIHLGARKFASLTHIESVYRLKPLDLKQATDDDLQRRLRGTLVVEHRATTDPDSSSRWPSKVAADEAFDPKDPWRGPDAGQRDAPSRCMAYIPTPYGKSSGQAPNDALAYRVRMDRSGERFKPMKRGRSDSTDEAAETPTEAPTEPAAETDSVAVVAKGPRPRSEVIASNQAFLCSAHVEIVSPSTTTTTDAGSSLLTFGITGGDGLSDGDMSHGDSDGGSGDGRGGRGGSGISGASAARILSAAAAFTLPVPVTTTESVLPPSPPSHSPQADHTATHHALLTLFVLPTIAQQNFGLLCSLLACFLSYGILGLRYCAAARMADPVRRSAQWLLARLSPYRLTREHIAACVVVLSHLWSREWWVVAGVAVWFALQGCCASRRAELAPHSRSERALHLFSWTASRSERAEQFGRGLMVVIAYCEDTPTAPTAEQLRVLELQLLSEMAEFVVLDLLLQHLLWARTRLLRWLDETEATPVD